MQIEMADIGADIAGARQAHQRIHIGAVEIDLAAIGVGDGADLAHALLEHAVGRGIGDHGGGEICGIGFGLGAKIGKVDIAMRVGGHDHDLHPAHRRRGGIGAVGRGRDEADVAVAAPCAR